MIEVHIAERVVSIKNMEDWQRINAHVTSFLQWSLPVDRADNTPRKRPAPLRDAICFLLRQEPSGLTGSQVRNRLATNGVMFCGSSVSIILSQLTARGKAIKKGNTYQWSEPCTESVEGVG
jgi:hypothetical protein